MGLSDLLKDFSNKTDSHDIMLRPDQTRTQVIATFDLCLKKNLRTLAIRLDKKCKLKQIFRDQFPWKT